MRGSLLLGRQRRGLGKENGTLTVPGLFRSSERPQRSAPPFYTSRDAMTNARSSEESAVIATFSTRRDAEVAKDYLDDEGIQTFVSSDDAGGMHPQMQRPHGVKLVGMSSIAPEAREMLEQAGLFPPPGAADTPEQRPGQDQAEDLTFSTERSTFKTGFSVLKAIFIIGFVGVVLGMLFYVL